MDKKQQHGDERSGRRLVTVILILFGTYAAIRTARSVTMLFRKSGWDGHDIRLIYETWRQFISPRHASEAFELVTYLPYVWWLLTPVFLFGWPGAKIVWCIANFGFAVFCCYRLSSLLEFNPVRFQLLLVFFFFWVSTGLVIGLGNVALATLAAAIAWFPGGGEMVAFPNVGSAPRAASRFRWASFNWRPGGDPTLRSARRSTKTQGERPALGTWGRTFWLVPAAMKHSLTFPLFAYEFVRRPKRTVVPCVILAAMILASMAWARVGFPQLLKGMKAGEQISSEVWMKENPTVSLLPAFQAVLGATKAAQIVNWTVWFALTAAFSALVRNRLVLFSGLLLLGLLPIHHRPYDMIVALPAMAVFLARDWRLACFLTVLLGVFETIQHIFGTRLPILNLIGGGYYQVVILAMLTGLAWVDRLKWPAERASHHERQAFSAQPAP